MLFTSIAAVLLTASFAVAEPKAHKMGTMSYKPGPFGLIRREDPGYKPDFKPCGVGSTCEESCGAGNQQCASNDGQLDCYLPASQNCCPNQSGHACDFGYYCTVDSIHETFCCPDGMDLVACAAKYSVSALAALATSTAPPTPDSTPVGNVTLYGSATVTSAPNNITMYTPTATIEIFQGAAGHLNANGAVSALVLGLMALYAAW